MRPEARRPLEFYLSFDGSLLQPERIRVMLDGSYWAAGRSLELINISIEHSLCIGAYRNSDVLQVGFARLVTDYMNFAWLSDVIVDEGCRGSGIGKAMVATLVTLPGFEDVRFALATRDAHGLYEQFGFSSLPEPEAWMTRYLRRLD